jgi:hypothetical protein
MNVTASHDWVDLRARHTAACGRGCVVRFGLASVGSGCLAVLAAGGVWAMSGNTILLPFQPDVDRPAGGGVLPGSLLGADADPRTTEHYDRARGNLDRHGVHFLTAYVAGV